MKLLKVPISSVVPWEKNPRGIKKADFERLKKQIKDLGPYKPLVAYEDKGKFIVLGGNMRIRALRELGFKEVEVSVITPKNEADKIKYALSDNDRAGFYEEDRLAELIYPELGNISLEEFKVDLEEAKTLKEAIELVGPDIKEETEEIRYFKRAHILISFNPDQIAIVKKALRALEKVKNLEVTSGAN